VTHKVKKIIHYLSIYLIHPLPEYKKGFLIICFFSQSNEFFNLTSLL